MMRKIPVTYWREVTTLEELASPPIGSVFKADGLKLYLLEVWNNE